MRLDPQELAAAVVRNNMGVGGIGLQVRAHLEGSEAVFAETGQRLPVAGGPAASRLPWLEFAVEGFGPGEQVALRWLGEAAAPGLTD